MFGYFVTGMIINFWTVSYSWRLSIIIQGILEIFPLIYIQSKNNVDVDIVEHKRQLILEGTIPEKSAENEIDESLISQLKVLKK